MGHGSKSCFFANLSFWCGLRASLDKCTVVRKVEHIVCSNLCLILVVSGCRKGGGVSSSVERK